MKRLLEVGLFEPRRKFRWLATIVAQVEASSSESN